MFVLLFVFPLLLQGKFVVRVLFFVGDGRNRCREVSGSFTDHLIRKHFPDQVDLEDVYGSSDP